MTEPLKPCPFCGGEADFLPDRLIAPGAEPPIFCDGCHASAMDADHWNRRAPVALPTREEVARTLYRRFAWMAEDYAYDIADAILNLMRERMG